MSEDADTLFAWGFAKEAVAACDGDAAALREAVALYRRAIDAGSSLAANNLGAMFENGRGVERSWAEAARLYRRAAEDGLGAAAFNLGHLYAYGRGVPHSDPEAVFWFERATSLGELEAFVWLGLFRAQGRGGRPDREAARRLWEHAARRGCGKAANNLGVLHGSGPAAGRDRAEAWAWFGRADALGAAGALTRRARLDMEMSDAERAEGVLRLARLTAEAEALSAFRRADMQ